MIVTAVCIRCGVEKPSPYEKCDHCQLDPREDQDDLVKSVYMSSERFDSAAARRDYDNKLHIYAQRIGTGVNIDYDPREIERLRMQLAEVESIDDRSLMRYLWNAFFPGILFVVILVGILIVLRQL